MSRIKLSIYIVSVFLLQGLASCEDPLNSFDLQITPEVFKNYKILQVVDYKGNAVSRATVTLISGDTKDLYNQEGYKDFTLTKSFVVFCLDPKRSATPDDPIHFRVSVVASGYVSQQVVLSIAGVSEGVQTVVLKKLETQTDGESEQITTHT